MKTIQMTLDEPLLWKVDQLTAQLHVTRSEFIRQALHLALKQHEIAALEAQHARGYAQHPAAADEVAEWSDEQHWGEE
ncbi:MAG: CopG family transcriptional regulator [Herpetosiphonaceae bacterium]|nr:CopG family transcriptional regulator [Herpetosiphonaceae bacterium]